MTPDPKSPHIPGFNILEPAGYGGMGTVYKAEQQAPRRIVALKVLTEARPDAASRAKFQHEASVIAGLEHPHILPLYGYGEHDGLQYLVLRYLAGGSVADRLRAGAVDLAQAEQWVSGIAEALAFAHQQNVIHRDVKPSNILLDEAGRAYLTDFGIAGAMADARQGLPTGSAAYMSPEQGAGETVDHRADIYSLAATLYEMLTGKKPYEAETALGVIVRHMHDPVPSARAINPAIPPAVDDLIQWGMAKDRRFRTPSSDEFVLSLREAMARPDQRIRPPETPPSVAGGEAAGVAGAAQETRKRPIVFYLALGLIPVCLLGLALLGGGAFALYGTPSAAPLPSSTRLPTASPTAVPPPTPSGQLLSDDFSEPSSGFAVQNDTDGGVAYVDGFLEVSVLRERVEWISPSERVASQDVDVQVVAWQVSGPARNEVAVLCRWMDQGNYTAFAISGDGTFSIWQKRDGETRRLRDWSPATDAAITSGEPQQIHVTCVGSSLAFEVNGVLLAEVTDPLPVGGDVALMAGLREPGKLVVRFDDIRVTH